jgi:putative OPT family oligopeptide transporter
MTETPTGFVPLVPADEQQPELTFRAAALGAVLGIVFGAASTYLALRVGLTVSASVPIAVIAIALLRPRPDKAGRSTRAILEHNITQTTGSAGESIAAAVVFTVPALILLGYPLQPGLATLIALTGGILGILMMVPLRRYLIVKEHGVLRYPEGKACAEILRVGELGGTSAKKVFVGMGVGAGFQALKAIFGGVKSTVALSLDKVFGSSVSYFGKTELACDFDPALLGVGYIIGYRTSLIMVGGSLLSSLILIPMVYTFGSGNPGTLGTATVPIKEMDAGSIWNSYIRHIGAGAVAMGGIFALVRALPAIWSALAASAKGMFGGGADAARIARTDRDTPLAVLLFGALGLVVMVVLVPVFQVGWIGAPLILVFGFLFSVVSSRVTGEVGSTSNPLSGMTIAVLMGTCGLFLACGMGGGQYAVLALMIGAIVCIAVSQAGTCSQDLKTGFLVGATPVRQQGALAIGVLASVLAVGWTAYGLNLSRVHEYRLDHPFAVDAQVLARSSTITGEDGKTYAFVRATDVPSGVSYQKPMMYGDAQEGTVTVAAAPGNYLVDPATKQAVYKRDDGIGGGGLSAPQARLMATVIDGILTQKLPWDLILIGVAISIFIELLGYRALTFAVGVYLPLSSTMPVFLGGLVRKIADRRYGRVPDADDEPEGTLYSSGLIAGASILGIIAAMQNFVPGYISAGDSTLLPWLGFLRNLPFGAVKGAESPLADAVGFAILLVLAWLQFRGARGPNHASAPSSSGPSSSGPSSSAPSSSAP